LPQRNALARQNRGFLDWFAVVLPCVAWLRSYDFRNNIMVRPGSCRPRS
jgi:hypothetical protein